MSRKGEPKQKLEQPNPENNRCASRFAAMRDIRSPAGHWTSQLAMESKTLNALQFNKRLNSTRNRIMLTPFP